MKMKSSKNIIFALALVLAALCTPLTLSAQHRNVPKYLPDSVSAALRRVTLSEVVGSYVQVEEIRLIGDEGDSATSVMKRPTMEIRASLELAYYPMRKQTVEGLYEAVRKVLPKEFKDYELKIYADGRDIEKLIPQYYSESRDGGVFTNGTAAPLITRVSHLSQPERGLLNRHIALWQSHGRYFDNTTGEWCWQRSRLWQTVEDLYTQSYVVPFLLPMLERAGASVLLPRERSVRTEEIIIDNDKGVDKTNYSEQGKWSRAGVGFAHLQWTYPSGHNPFTDGTSRMIASTQNTNPTARATWSAEVEESGIYSVYVSYMTHVQSIPDAHYTVHASGGNREFLVNQRMGGGMWICLGDFYFEAGKSVPLVTLDNYSQSQGIVTADAVKIGGGMGNIQREVHATMRSSQREYTSETSGYPRFTEGSRYWLQWSGFTTDVYAPQGGADDYKDDYMSRARWVNALMGGSERLNAQKGKSIPIDLALAFHSDAGARKNDNVVGTLGIYCTRDNGGKFEDEISRMRSRDLTDVVTTQIIEDIRKKYDSAWANRGLWDKAYYEARLPACPTMLLELLSHQNFSDMRYGLDPQFRFDVSRAIYKGILRYVSSQYGVDYVVQPLPVNSLSIDLKGNKAYISWQPTVDELESTAKPDYYILYTRIGNGGFDNGRRVDANYIEVEQKAGVIYSYRVTAVNAGGESFDSETLAAAVGKSKKSVLIVNGFDRVSAPESRCDAANAGFYNSYDSGVAYIQDISFIGEQTNYSRGLYLSQDDNISLGQSYNDYETEIVAGNSFDFVALHGASILAAGYSFSSASHAAIEAGHIILTDYAAVDLILGKQRATAVGRGEGGYRFQAMPKALQSRLASYTSKGGSLMITGSYMLTDMWQSPVADEADRKFAEDVLHVTFGGSMATRRGDVKTISHSFIKGGYDVKFNTEIDDQIYCVDSPEIVAPAGSGAYISMRYRSTNQSAAVAYLGKYRSFVAGFPFETILDVEQRNKMMQEILSFLIR